MENLEIDLLDFEEKKIKVEEIEQGPNKISIKQRDLQFDKEDMVFIFIKNIKTREKYLCKHSINENKLVISLDSLAHCFTDNEGAIFIILKRGFKYYIYTPILNKSSNIKFTDKSNAIYEWYLRKLDNGEFRISTIIKK